MADRQTDRGRNDNGMCIGGGKGDTKRIIEGALEILDKNLKT